MIQVIPLAYQLTFSIVVQKYVFHLSLSILLPPPTTYQVHISPPLPVALQVEEVGSWAPGKGPAAGTD